MTNKGVPGLVGPTIKNEGVEVNLPDCVKIVTEQDKIEFQTFISNIIKAANDNALDLLADYVAAQNIKMSELVKKLGA